MNTKSLGDNLRMRTALFHENAAEVERLRVKRAEAVELENAERWWEKRLPKMKADICNAAKRGRTSIRFTLSIDWRLNTQHKLLRAWCRANGLTCFFFQYDEMPHPDIIIEWT